MAATDPGVAPASGPARLGAWALGVLPGLLLCLAVTAVALVLEWGEAHLFGRAWLEALVLAILLGTALRTAWAPPARFKAGIGFSAKILLEVAVALLGFSLSAASLAAAGPGLVLGTGGVVALALGIGYALGRSLGLPARMAVLVACGNAICGNSAIAAVAPVIGAKSEDVASSIAFTAVLGVLVVIGLPLVVPLLHASAVQYGVLAGLTVYAVPQVLAATAPVGALSVQVGTLVKLVRVLMLGPIVLGLSLVARRGGSGREGRRLGFFTLVPWFILAFLAAAILRSAGLVPAPALVPLAEVAGALTVVAMAALGLGVDVRAVVRAGPRVMATVVGSLLVLGLVGLALIRVLGIA